MSANPSDGSTPAADQTSGAFGEVGLEVPAADAAEQRRGAADGLSDADADLRERSDTLDRVTDVANPVDPADAMDQLREVDDDDDRRP